MNKIVTVACRFDIEIDSEEMDEEELIEYISTLPVDDVVNMKINYDHESIEMIRVLRMRESEF